MRSLRQAASLYPSSRPSGPESRARPFVPGCWLDNQPSGTWLSRPWRLKGDFHRNGVFVEVEFGNIATCIATSSVSDTPIEPGRVTVAVLIAATERLARFFDSGVATFEAAKRLPHLLPIGIQMPICFHKVRTELLRRDRLAGTRSCASFVTSMASECHPFAPALGAEVMDPLTGIPRGEPVGGDGSPGERDPTCSTRPTTKALPIMKGAPAVSAPRPVSVVGEPIQALELQWRQSAETPIPPSLLLAGRHALPGEDVRDG